jgi:hypothetical protein
MGASVDVSIRGAFDDPALDLGEALGQDVQLRWCEDTDHWFADHQRRGRREAEHRAGRRPRDSPSGIAGLHSVERITKVPILREGGPAVEGRFFPTKPATLHDLADVIRRSVKRLFRLLATIAILAVTAVGLQISPAYAAYPSVIFDETASLSSASTRGSVTFFNRSVRVQGRVRDNSLGTSGYSQVRFDFFLDPNAERFTWTSRKALFHNFTDFNFVQEGPPGGIMGVDVTVCSTDGNCSHTRYVARPRA